MVVAQGEVWWADLPAPHGSAPGFRRPVVVVQGNALNRSRLSTTVCVALTSNLKTYGPKHPDVARDWNNLGSAWHDKGEDDTAIEYYDKALASDLKNFGAHHPEVAVDYNNLGIAWDDKDQKDKAIEYYEKALAIFKKAGREQEANGVEENIHGLRE